MDPVVHTLLGFTVAEAAGAAGPNEAALIAAAVGGALVADSDFLIRPLGPTLTLRYHHGPTHSLFGGILLSALWATAVSLVLPSIFPWLTAPFSLCFAFAYLGFLSHVGLDLTLHNNGIQMLWPFSKRWFRLPLFVGLNPLTASARCAERSLIICWICQLHSLSRNRVFYMMLFGVLLQLILWPWRRWVAGITLVWLSLYTLYTLQKKAVATRLAQNSLGDVRSFEVFPAGFGTSKWLAVGEGENGYEVVNIDLQRRPISSKTFFPKNIDPQIEKTYQEPMVRATLQNFIIPYGTKRMGDNSPQEIHFWDLAYHFTPKVALHMAKIKLNTLGNVESIDFRERW